MLTPDQRARLRAALAREQRAEQREAAARERRNAIAADLVAQGYSGGELARVLNIEPAPWRTVHRNTPYRWPGVQAGGLGGGGRKRGLQLDAAQAERLRTAHRALYEAGRDLDAAIDARTRLHVELHEQGSGAVEQAKAMQVHHDRVQRPLALALRAQGRTPRPRNRA